MGEAIKGASIAMTLNSGGYFSIQTARTHAQPFRPAGKDLSLRYALVGWEASGKE
jgi:hypothetical protein